MKKIILSIFCACITTIVSVNAAVHIRFWDNGVLVRDTIEAELNEERPLTGYYDRPALISAGHLAACDGYTFTGWRESEPLVIETTSGAEADTTSSIFIGSSDIDLYAVYKRSVTYYELVSSLGSTPAGNYVIVGKNGSDYYAMRGDGGANVKSSSDESKYPMAGLKSVKVAVCDDKIYTVGDTCVWTLSGSSNSWIWQNKGSSKYLYLRAASQSFLGVGGKVAYIYNMLYGSEVSMKIEIANNKVKMFYEQSTGWLFSKKAVNTLSFAPSITDTKHFGVALSNVFISSDTNNGNADFSGSGLTSDEVYIYKEAKETRYMSKCCGAYTLHLKPCGDNSCVADAVTESKDSTACTRLRTFTGVSLGTKTTDCTGRWVFDGWATEPCTTNPTSKPDCIEDNPYVLFHNHDTLYAVYKHITHGEVDYWSSNPDCTPYSVSFDPVNGKVGGSSNPQVIEETTIGNGISVPEASFSNCSGWDFVGWVKTPCAGVAAAPDYAAAKNGTYYPSQADETLYAVYKNGSLWTSYPMCSGACITLDAGTGTVGGSTTKQISEPSVNSGITLSADAVYGQCGAISVWTFAGWSDVKISGTTTVEPILKASGSLYRPITLSSDVLYAVYRRGSSSSDYKWSSMPSCEAYSVVLHTESVKDTLPESALGVGVNFPAAAVACAERWTFAGWHQGSPIEHLYTTPDDLYVENDTYVPSQNNEAFYAVYKHITRNYWTSNPDCTPYTISLHACEGEMHGGTTDVDSLETSAGKGIILPKVTPRCDTRGWSFKGWVEGGELSTTDKLEVAIYDSGYTYIPMCDNVQLYAVYQIDGYKQVTKTAELVGGKEYIVAFFWDYGNAYPLENFALSSDEHVTETLNLDLKPIAAYYDDAGNKYLAKPANNCKWQLEASGSYWKLKTKIGNNTYYLYSETTKQGTSVKASGADYTIDVANHRIGLKNARDNYKYLHFLNKDLKTFYADQNPVADRCDLYRSVGTVYSSWPHCAKYTVYFDGCDGKAVSSEIEETVAGKGITMPNVTNACSGWQFAGWATEFVEDETDDLTLDLYPAGALFVPNKDNMNMYAVYYNPSNDFELVTSQSGLYLGRNYIVVNLNKDYALGNTHYSNSRQINRVAVSTSNDAISSTDANIRWRLQGVHDAYVWYNVAAGKYLDLVTMKVNNVYYATLQSEKKDNFDISYQNGNYFYIRTIKGISSSYLAHYDTRSFKGFDSYSKPDEIYLYRQKAKYCSYPCSTPIEPLAWGDGTVTVESLEDYHAEKPEGGSVVISDVTEGEDGTWVIHHSGKPGRRLRFDWGGNHYRMTIPYVASPTYTPAVENNLPNHDLVILPNTEFTVGLETWLHTVTVYEDASLVIVDGFTLHVDTLYLRSDGPDHHPSVSFGGQNAAIVVNSGVVYHDRRLDDKAYYPFGMPYDAYINEIRYAGLVGNTTIPVYRKQFWIKYYDGATRAQDANAGTGMKETYWTHVAGNTLTGGIGYSIGVADNKVGNHNKRTFRFRMRPMSGWSKYEDGTNDRAVTITPSKVNNTNQKHHSGWNYVCNPYLHTYYPGAATEKSGLVNGHFKQVNGKWQIEQDGTQTVPYLTFYDASSQDYYQRRADNSGVQAFSPVFVQVEDKDMLLYRNPLVVNDQQFAPGLRRQATDEPRVIRTGLILYTSNGENDFTYDEAGLVISNQYTSEYELGADLGKESNSRILHVYTRNETHRLAYNALDEEAAAQPIQVGVNIPQAGTYTFFFDYTQYDPEDLEALWLTDYDEGQAVNLLEEIYTCTINKGRNESRFVLNAIVRKENNTTTNTESVTDNNIRVITHQNGDITISGSNMLTDLSVYDIAGRLIGDWKPNNHQWTLSLPQGVYAISVKDVNGQVNHIKVCSK